MKKKTTSNPKKQVNKSQKKGKKLGGVGKKNADRALYGELLR
jgi:hypothetical protein